MKKIFSSISFVFFVFTFFTVHSQNTPLKLLSGEYELDQNINDFNHASYSNLSLCEGKRYGIIQFSIVPSKSVRKQLKDNYGINLLAYLPVNSYFASFSSYNNLKRIKEARDEFSVKGIHPVKPEYKLHPKLANKNYPDYIKEGLKILVVASLYDGLSLTSFAEKLSNDGFLIKQTNLRQNRITLKVNRSQLLNLRNYPGVFSIEPINPPSLPENHSAGTLVRSNYLNSPAPNGLKYDGTGVTVMMQDDGVIGPHIDYEGRIDQSNITTNSGDHGDHCAGTIMSAGNLDPLAQGMAPGAFLYVFGSSNNNYNAVPAMYQNDELVITSKSYSNGCNAGYTTLSRDLDEQIDDYSSLIHVFSAGNSGTSDCGYGAGSGWGNVTGGHKVGKNVICVGNLTSIDALANSSSRGPAEDGRIKPDICAKGTNVYSTVDVNSYAYKTGTSMSCPGVAGSITQLYHAYKDLNGGQNPNSALIKGTVLNTAEDLGNPGPDFKFGWGRVNLRRAYNTLLNQQYFYDSVDNQGSKTITLNVPAGKEQLRVMVYWADVEGVANAATALVNDIDMQIISPSNTTYNPWVLDPTPTVSALNSNAVPGSDHLNNMEQITIDNPVAGNYTIQLSGYNIPSGPQDFYVVYEYRDSDVILTFPNGGDPLVPGETELIRWDAHGTSGSFSIEYSLDNGSSWNTIAPNVGSALRYYNWTVPSTLVTGQALVRVTRGTSSDVSDAGFSIIDVPTNINSTTTCNGLEISWDPVSSATEYTVFVLGNKYMDSLGSTSATQYTLSGLLPNTTYWVSVNARGNNGAIGRRAIAVQAQTGNSTTGTLSSFVSSANSTCDSALTVTFTNTSSNGNSYQWDFGNGATSTQTSPSQTYSTPGLYTVTLIADGGPCGMDTLVETNYVSVGQLSQPQINDVSICSSQSVTLTALSNYSLEWYDQPTGGASVASGSVYTTPVISNTATYYVQASSVGGTSYVGPVDNSVGNGGYFTSGGRHLVFDAYADFLLKSVWVDADGAGNRTIELRDANGTVLQSATINIPNGQSRINLNFQVSSGTDYQLGVASTSTPDLYRNNSGLNYPYTIANLVSIKQSNAGTPLAYYYFFYDWEIETPSCSSSRKPVNISLAQPPTSSSNVSSCSAGSFTLTANGTGNGTLNWYDASSGGTLLGSGNSFTTPLLSTSQTFYVEDSIPSPSFYGGPSDNSFGAGANYNGDHHLIFDCMAPSVLNSVKVYSSSAANRTIELRDDNGAVIDSRTVYIPVGENRVDLDFVIPVGSDYELGTVAGANQNLFRNSAGASYPYDINGVLEIKNSSAGLLGYPGYYYFFYDWEVSEMPCITSRIPVSVTIDTVGTVSIQPVSAICSASSSFNLSSSASGGTWTGVGIVDAQLGTFDPSVAGPGTHQIIYSVSAGACSGADTVDVVVNQSANPVITPTPSVCSASASISLLVSEPNGVWSGAGIIDSINGVFDPAVAGVGSHVITYTISGNCGAIDQTTIVVNNSPDPSISPLSSNNFCLTANPFSFSAVTPGGVWSGVGITNTSTGMFDPSIAGVGTHLIIHTISGVCGSSDSVSIIVESTTNATITPVSPVCNFDQSFNMTAATPGGIWTGAGIIDSIQGTFDPSALGPGVYNINYVVTSGCGANDQIDITILSAPSINAGIDEKICQGDTLVLSGSGGVSYQWDNGVIDGQPFSPSSTMMYTVIGTDSLGCTNSDSVLVTVSLNSSSTQNVSAIDSFTWNGQVYTQSGTYTQTLLNAEGCDSTVTLNLTLDFTGIESINLNGIQVYPNPTRNHIRIKGLESLKDLSRISLLDNRGRLIREIEINETKLDLTSITPGVYYIEIMHSIGTTRIKIIKS